jgi:hypothetical protein
MLGFSPQSTICWHKEVLMNYEAYVDNETKILTCSLSGEFDIETALSLSIDLRERALQSELNVLYDAQKLSVTQSIMPAYDFAEKLNSLLGDARHRFVKVAFLYKQDRYECNWKFYENAATNRGVVTKVFAAKEEAMKWLSL